MKWTMTKIPVIKGLDRFFTSIMGVTSYNKTVFFGILLKFPILYRLLPVYIYIETESNIFIFCHNDINTKNTPYWAMRSL